MNHKQKKELVDKIYNQYKKEYNTTPKRSRIFRYLNDLIDNHGFSNIIKGNVSVSILMKWYKNMKIKRIILLTLVKDNLELHNSLSNSFDNSIQIEKKIDEIYLKFPDSNKGGTKKCLRVLLPQLKDKMSTKELINILDKIKPDRHVTIVHCYKILCFLYKDNPDLLEYFQEQYRIKYTKLTAEDLFILKGDWYKKIATDLREHTKQRLQRTSSYPEKILRQTMYREISSLNKLEHYITKMYKNKIIGSEPLRWFFNTANVKMFKNVICCIGRDINPRNDIVRSSHSNHHAKEFVCYILSTVKNALNKYLLCKKEIHSLSTRELLDIIPDKREHNDTERRDFYEEEIQTLFKTAEKSDNKEKYLLYLCILREVGLRVGAIVKLKTYDLWDDGKPKKEAKVLEKKLSYRTFPIGNNLKKCIKDFMDSNPEIRDDPNAWLFQSDTNPNKHVTTNTLRDWLKKLCEEAEIYGLHVHPHAFRHTIVNNLMAQGNKIDNVSKFMGHSSVSTTEQYYWTSKLSNIIPIMNIPWLTIKNKHGVEDSDVKVEYDIDTESVVSENELNVDLLIPVLEQYHRLLSQEQLVELKKSVPQIATIYKMLYDYAESSFGGSQM